MTRLVHLFTGLGLFLLLATPALAQNVGAISGFGGLSIDTTGSPAPNLGGTIAFDLTPGIQVIGEVGHMGNVLPPLADAVFSVANLGIRASALYAEGGVRFQLPRAHVSPYAEATAGVARLDVSSSRFGAIGNGITSAALSLIGRTGPVAGAGGGVMLHAGPLVFDVGYRYKQLFPPDPLATVIGLGQTLRSQEVRFGVGVRF